MEWDLRFSVCSGHCKSLSTGCQAASPAVAGLQVLAWCESDAIVFRNLLSSIELCCPQTLVHGDITEHLDVLDGARLVQN